MSSLPGASWDGFVLPTRDCTYGTSTDPATGIAALDADVSRLDARTAAVAIGVRHAAVFDAAYSSAGLVVVENADLAAGPGSTHFSSWRDDRALAGSAARYFEATDAGDTAAGAVAAGNATTDAASASTDHSSQPLSSSLLFALDVMPPGECDPRDAVRGFCVELSEDAVRTGLEGEQERFLSLGERVYSVAKTGVGPDAAQMVPSLLLFFDGDDFNAL